jgi:hypothetical protein
MPLRPYGALNILTLRSHGFAVGQIPGPRWGPCRAVFFGLDDLIDGSVLQPFQIPAPEFKLDLALDEREIGFLGKYLPRRLGEADRAAHGLDTFADTLDVFLLGLEDLLVGLEMMGRLGYFWLADTGRQLPLGGPVGFDQFFGDNA